MRLLVVLALATGLVGCTSAERYRWSGRSQELRVALHDEVENGDTVERVHELLGPGREANGHEQQRLVSATRQFASRLNSCPDGTRDDDRFIGYASKEGGTLFLQFRDDKLINFNPDDFARADALHVSLSRGEPVAN